MTSHVAVRHSLSAVDRLGTVIVVIILHIVLAILVLLFSRSNKPVKMSDTALTVENIELIKPRIPSVNRTREVEPNRTKLVQTVPAGGGTLKVRLAEEDPFPTQILSGVDQAPANSSFGTGVGVTGQGEEGSGRGEASERPLSRRAIKLSGYISSEDYPRSALDAHAQGTTTARFSISQKGQVSECDIVSGSGHSDLDGAICKLLKKRFRFRPALSANGEPTSDTLQEVFTWILPVKE